MNYKLGKYLAHTDEFEFVFDDGRWVNIDLVNDFPNYIHYDKLQFDKENVKNQTSYDKKCYKENTYSDNSKLYIVLFNLFNDHIKITCL
jgi:hypothetical protein